MKTKLVTLTINYPETNFNEECLEQYILEALSGSDDLRECFGEVIDIHDAEPQEEGDA